MMVLCIEPESKIHRCRSLRQLYSRKHRNSSRNRLGTLDNFRMKAIKKKSLHTKRCSQKNCLTKSPAYNSLVSNERLSQFSLWSMERSSVESMARKTTDPGLTFCNATTTIPSTVISTAHVQPLWTKKMWKLQFFKHSCHWTKWSVPWRDC